MGKELSTYIVYSRQLRELIYLITQVAKRKMEMLFVRGDGVILVRCWLLLLLHSLLTGVLTKGIATIENIRIVSYQAYFGFSLYILFYITINELSSKRNLWSVTHQEYHLPGDWSMHAGAVHSTVPEQYWLLAMTKGYWY